MSNNNFIKNLITTTYAAMSSNKTLLVLLTVIIMRRFTTGIIRVYENMYTISKNNAIRILRNHGGGVKHKIHLIVVIHMQMSKNNAPTYEDCMP